jgi:hypothetical protein
MGFLRLPAVALVALGVLVVDPAGSAFSPRAASASVALGVTLDELVQHSDLAIVGEAVESQSRWETVAGGRRIVTYTRLQPLERVYGQPPAELWVRTLGGVVGRIGQQVSGEARLPVGSHSLLFLTKSPDGALVVTARAQGHFFVVADDAGTRRLRPSPDVGSVVARDRKAQTARAELGDRPLGAALDLVTARRGRAHAGR